jgi:hypothetical protein
LQARSQCPPIVSGSAIRERLVYFATRIFLTQPLPLPDSTLR